MSHWPMATGGYRGVILLYDMILLEFGTITGKKEQLQRK